MTEDSTAVTGAVGHDVNGPGSRKVRCKVWTIGRWISLLTLLLVGWLGIPTPMGAFQPSEDREANSSLDDSRSGESGDGDAREESRNSERDSPEEEPDLKKVSTNALVLQTDFGSATQFGVGYMRFWAKAEDFDFSNRGIGATLKLNVRGRVDAAQLLANTRIDFGHLSGNTGFQVGLGAGVGREGVYGMGTAEFFGSLFAAGIDMGYLGQFPLEFWSDSPAWTRGHFIVLRFNGSPLYEKLSR